MIPGRITLNQNFYISCKDDDHDTLNNRYEDANGNGVKNADVTDPQDADTDDDGIADGIEINGDHAVDPLNADTDSDGVQDGQSCRC